MAVITGSNVRLNLIRNNAQEQLITLNKTVNVINGIAKVDLRNYIINKNTVMEPENPEVPPIIYNPEVPKVGNIIRDDFITDTSIKYVDLPLKTPDGNMNITYPQVPDSYLDNKLTNNAENELKLEGLAPEVLITTEGNLFVTNMDSADVNSANKIYLETNGEITPLNGEVTINNKKLVLVGTNKFNNKAVLIPTAKGFTMVEGLGTASSPYTKKEALTFKTEGDKWENKTVVRPKLLKQIQTEQVINTVFRNNSAVKYAKIKINKNEDGTYVECIFPVFNTLATTLQDNIITTSTNNTFNSKEMFEAISFKSFYDDDGNKITLRCAINTHTLDEWFIEYANGTTEILTVDKAIKLNGINLTLKVNTIAPAHGIGILLGTRTLFVLPDLTNVQSLKNIANSDVDLATTTLPAIVQEPDVITPAPLLNNKYSYIRAKWIADNKASITKYIKIKTNKLPNGDFIEEAFPVLSDVLLNSLTGTPTNEKTELLKALSFGFYGGGSFYTDDNRKVLVEKDAILIEKNGTIVDIRGEKILLGGRVFNIKDKTLYATIENPIFLAYEGNSNIGINALNGATYSNNTAYILPHITANSSDMVRVNRFSSSFKLYEEPDLRESRVYINKFIDSICRNNAEIKYTTLKVAKSGSDYITGIYPLLPLSKIEELKGDLSLFKNMATTFYADNGKLIEYKLVSLYTYGWFVDGVASPNTTVIINGKNIVLGADTDHYPNRPEGFVFGLDGIYVGTSYGGNPVGYSKIATAEYSFTTLPNTTQTIRKANDFKNLNVLTTLRKQQIEEVLRNRTDIKYTEINGELLPILSKAYIEAIPTATTPENILRVKALSFGYMGTTFYTDNGIKIKVNTSGLFSLVKPDLSEEAFNLRTMLLGGNMYYIPETIPKSNCIYLLGEDGIYCATYGSSDSNFSINLAYNLVPKGAENSYVYLYNKPTIQPIGIAVKPSYTTEEEIIRRDYIEELRGAIPDLKLIKIKTAKTGNVYTETLYPILTQEYIDSCDKTQLAKLKSISPLYFGSSGKMIYTDDGTKIYSKDNTNNGIWLELPDTTQITANNVPLLINGNVLNPRWDEFMQITDNHILFLTTNGIKVGKIGNTIDFSPYFNGSLLLGNREWEGRLNVYPNTRLMRANNNNFITVIGENISNFYYENGFLYITFTGGSTTANINIKFNGYIAGTEVLRAKSIDFEVNTSSVNASFIGQEYETFIGGMKSGKMNIESTTVNNYIMDSISANIEDYRLCIYYTEGNIEHKYIGFISKINKKIETNGVLTYNIELLLDEFLD